MDSKYDYYGEPLSKRKKLSCNNTKNKDKQQRKKKNTNKSKKKNNNKSNKKKIGNKMDEIKKQQKQKQREEKSNQKIEKGIEKMRSAIKKGKYWMKLSVEQKLSYYASWDENMKQRLENKAIKDIEGIAMIEDNMNQYLSSKQYKQAWKATNSEFTRAENKSDFILKKILPPLFHAAFDNDSLSSIPTSSPKQHSVNIEGIRFSYWKSYKAYPYVAPKYDHLKEELLQSMDIDVFNTFNNKTELLHKDIHNILGQKGDINSPYARDKKKWNINTNIEVSTIISLHHLLSILVITDSNNINLPLSLIKVCQRKDKNESFESVKKRHSEYAICLRLLFETIVLYGNNLLMNNTVYFGCNVKCHFKNIDNIIKLSVPLRGLTSNCNQALKYANNNGIVIKFGGLQSNAVWSAPYFDAKLLTSFSDQQQLIFFHAELKIMDYYYINDHIKSPILTTTEPIISSLQIPNQQEMNEAMLNQANELRAKLQTLKVWCPHCIDTKLVLKLSHKAYRCRSDPMPTVTCDKCNIKQASHKLVFHCPNGYQNRLDKTGHVLGYDLCIQCAQCAQQDYQDQDIDMKDDNDDDDDDDVDDDDDKDDPDYEPSPCNDGYSSATSLFGYDLDNYDTDITTFTEDDEDRYQSEENNDDDNDEKKTEFGAGTNKINKPKKKKYDRWYESILKEAQHQCSKISFKDKYAKQAWKAGTNEARRSQSATIIKRDYVPCGTCGHSFGSDVSSPLQCTYHKVPRCKESNGYHHYGSFMPNRSKKRGICFWCHSYKYFKRNPKNTNSPYYQSTTTRDLLLQQYQKQNEIYAKAYRELWDKVMLNEDIAMPSSQFPRPSVIASMIETPTTSISRANITNNNDRGIGKVYHVDVNIDTYIITALIYYELTDEWDKIDCRYIHNQELKEQIQLHLKRIPICHSPGFAFVNNRSLKINDINMTSSIVRIGGIHGGGYLIRNYFTEKEESIIVNGHEACFRNKDTINKHFRLQTGIDITKHEEIGKRDPKTVEDLDKKSTVWMLIIILYHAVASPQLHETGFGKKGCKDKLQNIINDENDIELICKYIDCMLNVFGDKYKLLCHELGIDENDFVAYQTQHYYANNPEHFGLRLNGHRDTWKLGDRGFVAGTFINSSTIVFTDRYNQKIIFTLNKPRRSLLIIEPKSFLAIKAKHHLKGMESDSLTALARMESTNYDVTKDTNKRRNRKKNKSSKNDKSPKRRYTQRNKD